MQHTPIDHPDRQYLQEALAKAEEFCTQVIFWKYWFLNNLEKIKKKYIIIIFIFCLFSVGKWRS